MSQGKGQTGAHTLAVRAVESLVPARAGGAVVLHDLLKFNSLQVWERWMGRTGRREQEGRERSRRRREGGVEEVEGEGRWQEELE